MSQSDRVAVIGGGVIGSAIACALAREGRSVVLLDRDEPGRGGASFGNAGHIATELVQPLPSPSLLFGFWRELFAFDGPLDIPAKRLVPFASWAARFALAAFRRERHTEYLAPLVRPAAADLHALLDQIGRADLIRRNGHYELWLGEHAHDKALAQAQTMERIGVPTQEARPELLEAAARRAGHAGPVAGLWFPNCAHVIDPLEVVRALVTAAAQCGATLLRKQVRALRVNATGMEVLTDDSPLLVRDVVVCAGAWSAPLLAPFGLRAPLEAARGYHVEMPDQQPLADAPVLYADANIVVTPFTARLRASSYMEFAGVEGPSDPRKPERLRAALRKLGYECDATRPSWVGPRPVLPDYLPAIGRVPSVPNLYYAFGHQHIGLTLAAVTSHLVADLLAGRSPRHDISRFDLRRFGTRGS
jgi:D-hydroxyproline dehydrogenase